MKYNPPYGSTDPNASYVDRDTPSAIKGSAVPAVAIEDPQRELVNLIAAAGLTPSNGDLTQVAKAIQSGRMNFATAGGSANALTATLAPAPLAYADGLKVILRISTLNTGPATLNLNSLGALPILHNNGYPLTGSELSGVMELTCVAGYAFLIEVVDATQTVKGNARAATQAEADAGTSDVGFLTPLTAFKLIVNRQVLTSSQTYTRSANMVFAEVEICAGGGGGGGAFGAPSPNVSAASGGGAGGYCKKLYTALEIGASAVVIIGAGGPGGAAGQNDGSSGGASTFAPAGSGPILTALGGVGSPFGITATSPNRGAFLGSGGAASGGDVNIRGAAGGWAYLFGGSAAYTSVSGRGGYCPLGFGGQESQENAAGNTGIGYGGGGGGGAALTVSKAGGAGSQGVCIITEYLRRP